jgi:predicted permease
VTAAPSARRLLPGDSRSAVGYPLAVQIGWTVLSAVVAVFAVVAAGAGMRLRNWLTAEADDSLTELTVRLLMPCFTLKVTMTSEALKRPENLLWPPILGIGTLVLSFAGAALLARLGPRLTGLHTPVERRTFSFVAGTFNYGYIPIPLVSLLFPGDGTLGVLMVYMLGVELGFWTVGVLVLTGGVGGAWKKRLLNPPSVGIVVGVLLNLSGTVPHIPAFLMQAIALIGSAAIPIGVLLVGAMSADHLSDLRMRPRIPTLFSACVLRALLAPAAFVALAYLLPLSLELRRVLVVEAAMPAAMFSIVIARYYKADGPLAVRIVIVTSLVSLLAIPLWISGGLALLQLR